MTLEAGFSSTPWAKFVNQIFKGKIFIFHKLKKKPNFGY